MTAQDRKEIQDDYELMIGLKVLNSRNEFDINYVEWIEEMLYGNFKRAEKLEAEVEGLKAALTTIAERTPDRNTQYTAEQALKKELPQQSSIFEDD